jgi:hypothetical protein
VAKSARSTLRPVPALFAVFGDDIGEDAAAHEELGGQAHEARFGGLDQVVEDAVGDGLVETAFVAERPDVELEALEFDAGLFRDVVEDQRGESQAGRFSGTGR